MLFQLEHLTTEQYLAEDLKCELIELWKVVTPVCKPFQPWEE